MSSRVFSSLAVIASLGFASAANAAATCPEEHILTEAREIERIGAKGMKAKVLSEIDLTDWREMGHFKLRTREIIVEPGGTVPTHSHEDRPSIVHVISGELVEHNAYCAVPIVHKPGNTTGEFGPGFLHWWENAGDVPAVVISSDVISFKPSSTD